MIKNVGAKPEKLKARRVNRLRAAERRKSPRIAKELPINIAADGYGFSTTTQNVSCTGVYCRVNRYIPPFTKIAVKMALPIVNPKTARNSLSCLECKGVVVRTEDEDMGGFNIAIFFNDINDSQRQKISRYVNQFLPQ